MPRFPTYCRLVTPSNYSSMHFVIYSTRATCLAHPIFPELIIPITFDEEVTRYTDRVPARSDMKQIKLQDSFLFFFFFITTITQRLPLAEGTTAISFPLSYKQNSFVH